MTWIPTSKQLPPDGEVVEAQFEELAAIRDVTYYRELDRWYFNNIQQCRYTPTHWRKKLNNGQ
jgi:hypothetical protein